MGADYINAHFNPSKFAESNHHIGEFAFFDKKIAPAGLAFPLFSCTIGKKAMQDRQLIATLFRRHYERMLLTARTLLRDNEAARDVVSDVFAELLASDRPLDEAHIEGFLLVSVRNKCLNIVKQMMRQQRAINQHSAANDPSTIDEDYTEPPLDDILRYIRDNLTPQTREVMLRRYGQQKRYNEIASELGISRTAVYKHIAQALTKLKKHFLWTN